MNVAIIEDHKIIAEALKNTLHAHSRMKEIKLFYSADSFLEIKDWKPDLIISDLLMPGKSGTELIKAYRIGAREDLKIIVLSSVVNRTAVKQVIKQGANGYLSKEESLEDIVTAIYKILEGEQYISKALGPINNFPEETHITYHLSPRERDVLKLVCSGRIMKEVAVDLGLSIHTVQSYHKNLMRKFKVRRTSDLIVLAIQTGFYNPENRTL